MRTRSRTPRPLYVLVVDGYPDSAASLALLLSIEGFTARAVLTGGEARAVAADPPDVVVVEPRTPGVGWDLVRRLAEKVAGRWPLLVALTTDATPAARLEADAAGIDLYLVKPADPAVLVGALRRFERVTLGFNPVSGAGEPEAPRTGITTSPRESWIELSPAGV